MPAAFSRNIAGFSPAGNSRSYFQGRNASEMKRKCRPKGLAQNPSNARQIIVHFMILRQTGAAQFMGPEPKQPCLGHKTTMPYCDACAVKR